MKPFVVLCSLLNCGCEAACKRPVSYFCMITKQQCFIKCICQKGFVRSTLNDTSKCVPIAKCKKFSE